MKYRYQHPIKASIRFTSNGTKFWFNTAIASAIIIFILAYSLFQARRLIEGPRISISSPVNGATLNDSLVYISGVAQNINEISVDDRSIFVDEQGNFKEKLLLYPGYNIIKVNAKDKFGNEVEKKVEVIFKNT